MDGERNYDGRHAGAGDLGNVIDETKNRILGPCPGCGAELKVGPVEYEGAQRHMLLHAMPFCHYFGATDPDRIVEHVEIAKLVQSCS